ncbi:heparinase II/III family protein [Erwiniaceae bacterium BAC15a-03b]|uniref:Heparinase II/III family protein n=1 Tax=Winslowiella arboricola TaxID=2978220 RepID=A0A9J6PMT6_9GAMM|nr:heparinase II/III family protein [Winslowiella arboricola]MCU5773821.1 heparinase II/III family protein [Winslowiella arboricola]MCU5777731.1 heparinase II/III family protein [Winslowiella arboricola]
MRWQPLLIDYADIERFRSEVGTNSLLGRSLNQQIAQLNRWLQLPLEIPGHGEAGGPEHARHKLNYQIINQAGRLWLITDDQRYRDTALTLLKGYADCYPQLGSATSRDTNPPGRLFHQTLNEHMFLLYAAEGYHCIISSLNADDRHHIEENLLRLMAVEAMTLHAETFDIVHNHGLWSVAAVALCGYVLNDQQLVDKSLYGLAGDSQSGGFFAQLDGLFSPDGYYIEGPYYHRFGLRPLLLLAEAIAQRQPELDIWHYRQQLIYRTCYTLFALAFPDDSLPALNDASRSMSLQDEGALIAVSVCWRRYGADARLAALAQRQGVLWLGGGAAELSRAVAAGVQDDIWPSLLVRDGEQGECGAIAVLRQRDEQQDTHMALLWYGQHGSIPRLHSALNHGHFDGLHLSWFNRGREVLKDYGFGRWVNVEPKFGGRYIPENNSYCKQTVAHNTVVVDQRSQNQGTSSLAEQRHGETCFFITDHPDGQGISAQLQEYYAGVTMRRTVLMLQVTGSVKPLLLDLYSLQSQQQHQYDYCLHTDGQLVNTNFQYSTGKSWNPLGDSDGYQHLWRCAQGEIAAGDSALISWLDGDSFYSACCALPEGGEAIIARSGASDPNFNLRSEPAWIWRTHGDNVLFACAIETHGYFDEATETSLDARGKVRQVKVKKHLPDYSEVSVHFVDGREMSVVVTRDAFDVSWQTA